MCSSSPPCAHPNRTHGANVRARAPSYPPFVSVGGGVAITYGALHDKLVARGHNVTVVSPRLNNCDHGETNLYAGQPVILCTWSNILMFKRLFEANDVAVTPDETQVPLFCFLAHWTNTPLLLNMHTCALCRPLLRAR